MATDCNGNEVKNIGQVYVISVSLFFWWALHRILEKYANMAPVIKSTASLERLQNHIDNQKVATQRKQNGIINATDAALKPKKNPVTHHQHLAQSPIQNIMKQLSATVLGHNETDNSESEQLQSSKILMKLTKSIDKENKYRIKQRASMIFTLFAFRLILFFVSISGLIATPDFIRAQFWDLEECSVYNEWLQYGSALCVSAYGWECAMLSSYAHVDAIVYVHHWLTVLAACNIMYGIYSPLAANYALFHLAFNPVVKFCTAFRFEYSNKYPEFTRKLCRFSVIYTSTILVCIQFSAHFLIFNHFACTETLKTICELVKYQKIVFKFLLH